MASTLENDSKALECTFCGGPLSKNPHPDAGKPSRMLEVGYEWQCIPCTVRTRNNLSIKVRDLSSVLAALIKLKDGPRDDNYYQQRESVWQRARHLVQF